MLQWSWKGCFYKYFLIDYDYGETNIKEEEQGQKNFNQFQRAFRLKSLLPKKYWNLIHSTISLNLSKERHFLKKILLLSFKRAGVSHLQNTNKRVSFCNKQMHGIYIKKEVVLYFKNFWLLIYLALWAFIFSLQFRAHSLPFSLWLHSYMISPTPWLTVASNFPLSSTGLKIVLRCIILVFLVLLPCYQSFQSPLDNCPSNSSYLLLQIFVTFLSSPS